jgi:hypothetical protein
MVGGLVQQQHVRVAVCEPGKHDSAEEHKMHSTQGNTQVKGDMNTAVNRIIRVLERE